MYVHSHRVSDLEPVTRIYKLQAKGFGVCEISAGVDVPVDILHKERYTTKHSLLLYHYINAGWKN